MRNKLAFVFVAGAAVIGGVGCGAEDRVGNRLPVGPVDKPDLAIKFEDVDASQPPEADAGPQELNGCGDFDPACQQSGLGPDNGKPFPLPSDPMKDPNAQADGIGRNPAGYLVLDQTKANFNFIWVANSSDLSGKGTVSKVDSKTLKEVARYRTVTCFSLPTGSKQACDGKNGCCAADSNPQYQNRRNKQPEGNAQQVQLTNNAPSRTSVDYNGDLFVANRAFGGQAAVTKIANELANCKDRNKNGRIETAGDRNKDGIITTDCNGNGLPDDIDDVKGKACNNGMPQEFFDVDDECVLFTTNHGASNSTGRPLGLGPGTVDNGPSDAYAGGYSTGKFYRIDGITGKTKSEWQLPGGCSPYGLAVDATGYGWAPNLGSGPLCFFDSKNEMNVGRARDPQSGPMSGYGVTLDRDQNIWVGSSVHRYTPDRSKGFANLAQGWWVKINGASGIGIAADSRTPQKYFVWSQNGSRVLRIPGSDIKALKMDQVVNVDPMWPTINSPGYGVGIDADQGVVSVNSQKVVRAKVDAMGNITQPNLNGPANPGEICPVGDTCPLNAGAYTYSDFTGFGLRTFTRPAGTYSYVVRGCVDEGGGAGNLTQWYQVKWDADVPPNTTLGVRVRSGPTKTPDQAWGQWTTETRMSPMDLTFGKVLVPNGPDEDNAYYLQVEFTLKTGDRNSTPKLKAFDVSFKCGVPPG